MERLLLWGSNTAGQSTVPAGLMGVVAIAARFTHSIAIKADESIVTWGEDHWGSCIMTNVTALSSGFSWHTLALQSNGSGTAWGKSTSGQSSVPAGLTGVVAVAAGGSHSLVLKSDGTVVAWGSTVCPLHRLASCHFFCCCLFSWAYHEEKYFKFKGL